MNEAQARAALSEVYEPEGVQIWLHSRNAWMANQRPIDLITAGDTELVERAIDILVGGAYA